MPATTGGRPTSGTRRNTYRPPKRRVTRAPSTHDVGVTQPKPKTTLGGQPTPPSTTPSPKGRRLHRKGQRKKAAADRGRAVRTMGPLARQLTFTERSRARSRQLKARQLRALGRLLDGAKGKPRVTEQPHPELPSYYEENFTDKTFRALERHVARTPKTEAAERRALEHLSDEDKPKTGERFAGVGRYDSKGPLEQLPRSVAEQVEAELEGRGELAKGARTVKRYLSQSGRLPSTLRKRILGPIGLGPLSDTEVGKAAVRDLVDIPAQAGPSVYGLTAGAVDAAQGRPERIKKLAKEFVEHDP